MTLVAFGGSAFLDVQDHRLPCLSHDSLVFPKEISHRAIDFANTQITELIVNGVLTSRTTRLHQQPPKLGSATVKVAIRQDPNGSTLRTVSNAVSPLPWELGPCIGDRRHP